MAFFSWSSWLGSRVSARAKTYRRKRPGFYKLSLEALEDRTLLSVLPAPLVTNPVQITVPAIGTPTTTPLSGFSPSVAQDPVNPLKLFEVHDNGSLLLASYSTDGGQTWTGFINVGTAISPVFKNVIDPSTIIVLPPSPGTPYPQLDHATVTMDRGENIYITALEHNGNTKGALVFYRYQFTGGTPTAVGQPTVLQQWLNSDPIYNPIVAVDNNINTFTDPSTGAVQTDTLAALTGGVAKALVVAWNTADTAPTIATPNTVFNPNVIRVMASSNGGATFTSPQIVNNNGYLESSAVGPTPHFAAPQIVFTQGSADGQTPGGQMVVVWNDFASNVIDVDASQLDAGSATNPAPAAWISNGATNPIVDAGTRVNTAPIATGGIGYSVGDTLTVQNGPVGIPVTIPSAAANQATLQVTAVGAVAPVTVATFGAVAPVTIATGGSNYVVNDVLTVVGGVLAPGGLATQLTVSAVNAGAVTAATITRVGSYVTAPTSPVSVTGGGATATGATFNVSFIPLTGSGYVVNDVLTVVGGVLATPSAVAQTVAAGGSGYVVNDVLTVVGGVLAPGGLATQLTVTTVTAAGAVAAVNITRVGSYSTPPTSPVSTTGGAAGATGATFNVIFSPVGLATQLTVTGVTTTGVTTAVISRVGSYATPPTNPVSVTGGAAVATGATFNVNFSTITAISIVNAGSYVVVPTIPVATVAVPAGGTGATFSLTYGGTAGTIPDLATANTFTTNVTITDPTFIVRDLELTLVMTQPHLNQIRVELVQPVTGTRIVLVDNKTDGNNASIVPARGLADTANMGKLANKVLYGTIFSDNAARSIADVNATPLYTAHFRPEASALDQATIVGLQGTDPAISGTWQLVVTDFKNDAVAPTGPVQTVDSWSLRFSDISPSTNTAGGFGTDRTATSVPGITTGGVNMPLTGNATGNVTTPYAMVTNASGPAGIGPSISVAVDNTLGSFSPFQGRLYLGYTAVGGGGTDTDVYLASGDLRSTIQWNSSLRVNDDTASDYFSEGTRPQFLPTVAVDQTTGTVGVMYYDGRYDPALFRVATSFRASIDGGQTFSPNVFVSQPKTATDALDTTKTIFIEPVPGNQGQAGALGFGDRQSLIMYAGKAIPVFSSNLNAAGAFLQTAAVTFAAGPRIIQGDMGPVQPFSIYNTLAGDGRRQFNAFEVTFDRPIDPSTFTTADVTVIYKNPSGVDTTLTVSSVTRTNGPSVSFGSRTIGSAANPLATQFVVVLATPQTGPGTYRYVIGSNIGDRMRTPNSVALGGGGSLATLTTLTGDTAPDTFSIATTATFGPVTADQLIFSTTGYAHSHGGSVDIFVEVHNPVTSLWTEVYRQTLTNSAQFNFDGLTINFTPQLVDQVRLNSNPFQNQTYHNWGSMVLAVNATGVQISAVAPNINLRVPPAGTGGSLGGVVWPTPPANNVDTTVSTIAVSGLVSPISDVNVKVQVNHPSNADLAMRLIAPNGAAAVLTLHRGGSAANGYANTTFDDEASFPISGASPPYTLVIPEQSLSVFDGMTPAVANGNWVLQINDDAAVNTGTLVGWSLVFNSAIGTPTVLNPGNLMDQNNNAITNQGGSDRFAVPQSTSGVPFALPYAKDSLPLMLSGPHMVSTSVPNNPVSTDNRVINGTNNVIDVTFDRDILVSTFTPASLMQIMSPSGAVPLPAGSVTVTALSPSGAPLRARTFRITFPPQALSGTYNLVFSPTMQDIDGNSVDTNLNAGLDVLRGASSAVGSVKVQYVASAVPVTLNAGQTVSATLSVADSFLIQQSTTQHIQLQLKISHQNIPDLEAQLIAPDGTTVQLFRNVGTFGTNPHADMNDTILDDFATVPIQNVGTPIGTGPFNPQLPLSVLNGHGVNGDWTLSITNHGALAGTLDQWSLFFPKASPSTGLGELIADQFSPHFRIFTQDPANSLTTNSWTAIGPAAENVDGNSGRIGGLAVDPSDPSGNTVFVAGASGGVWKTTNFFTTDPIGPTYVPLTDFGPAFSLNTGSIAVFGRSNDPNQTIVFVATGEGDIGSPGVGFLRSMDGGKTWQVLDSTNNVDAANPANPNDPDKIAKISSPVRNHLFVNSTAFKVIVDPTALPNGQVAVYAALSGTAANGGIWRSLDTGKTWTRIRAGNATDVILAAGGHNASGNLDKLFAAFRGDGVYFTPSALSANTMSLMVGGGGAPLRRDVDVITPVAIPVSNPISTPNGNFGRILLAAPALTNKPLQDAIYQGWLYALVVSAGNSLQGLYLTKDFGANWTNVRIPVLTTAVAGVSRTAYPTNNETRPDYDPFAPGQFGQGNYDASLAIDPNNPNVVYIGGTADDAPSPAGGMIRVDVTTLSDPYALVAYDNSDPGAGPIQFASTGPISVKAAGSTFAGVQIGPGLPYGVLESGSFTTGTPTVWSPPPRAAYFNLLRDPVAPFTTSSSLQFTNVANFNNGGDDARWSPFNDALEGTTDQHELIAFRDPLTGMTRLIFGDDQGVFTGVDHGDGTFATNVGAAPLSFGSRNGNLQIIQFYYGAAQPSTLAADLAGAMFYGNAQDDGFPISGADLFHTGELSWTGSEGDGAGIATDQTGSGTSYTYRWPCCGGSNPLPTDFFMVQLPGGPLVSRMGGPGASLIQPGDNPKTSTGQWPFAGGATFAVNPIDGSGLLISGLNGGIIYRTTDMGLNWFKVGNTAVGDVDGTYAPALAFGAPSTAAPGVTNDFLYAGTTGGKIFVTFNGGGVGQWTNISNGLDGSAVQTIVANPRPDSKEAYALTRNGVYWMQDSSAALPTWVKLNNTVGQGNLFNLNLTIFGNQGDTAPIMQAGRLTSLAVDWRWAIPDAVGTHPVLYVAGEGGVLRTTDKGVTWSPFPAGASEQQTITIPSTVTSLTFNYNGAAATPLAFSPATTAADVLLNLQSIVALNGNVSVAGLTGGPYVVTFVNQLGFVDVIPLTVTNIAPGGAITVVETSRGIPNGGYLPSGEVTDLDLEMGNINPATGFPDESAGLNMLVAFTYGRGAFAIRLDNSAIAQYAVTPRFGPRVLTALPGSSSVALTFSGPVDSASFTSADVTQNERQIITVTPPVTSITFSYDGTPAASALAYSATTTAVQLQDHLETIPALLTSEQQTVIITGGASSVIFSFNGTAATALNFSLATTAAQFQANLETIPALAGNISVAGSNGGPFVVTFKNALFGKAVALLTANSGGVTVSETVQGGPNIRVTGPAGGPYVVTFLHKLAGQDVALLLSTWNGAGTVAALQSIQGGAIGLLDPNGNPIAPTSVVKTSSANNAYRINLPLSDPGFYSFVLGPNVSDFSGNRMDQDQDLLNGEISDDMFSGRVLLQPFSNLRPVIGASIKAPNPNPTLPSILEDDVANTGIDLAAWIAGLPSDALTDSNDFSYASYASGKAPRGIAVTSVDNTNGRWQYATDAYNSNPFWYDFGAPSATAARLLEVNGATRIRFVPNANFNSTIPGSTVQFTFQAWDLTSGVPGGTGDASTGFGTSISVGTAATAVLTVGAVNDAPVNTVPALQTILQDTPRVFSAAIGNLISVADSDDADNTIIGDETVQVALTAANGTLTLSSTAGLSFSFFDANGTGAGDGTADATMTFRGTLTNVNAALNGMIFSPSLGFSGAAGVTITTNDLGNFGAGTALTDTDSVAITVLAVNNAPANSVPAAQTTLEDTTLVFSAVNGNLISVSDPDDADDTIIGNEPVQVTLTAVNGTLTLNGTTGLSFSFSDANGTGAGNGTANVTMTFRGTLSNVNAALNGLGFAPTLNFNGAGSVTIIANDRGNFGVGGSKTDTDIVAITIDPVNDPPTFTLAGNPPAVNEDAGAQTVNNFATALSVGPANESGQTLVGFTIIMTGSTGGLTFTSGPVIDVATGKLTYQTALDANGSATFSVTLADDGASGPPPNNNTSVARTFTITVNAINDAPTFTLAGNPPNVNEDAGAQTVNNFATAISAGAPNEIQTLTFTVTPTGTTGGLTFTTAPIIDAITGNLTYQTALDANGTATFSVTLSDSGPAGPPPNANTSAAQTFTITVNPINDSPTFTLPATTSSPEDAGAQTVNNFATARSTGPANESAQTLVNFSVTLTGSTGGLTFATPPAINAATGALTYQAASNANGTATFSVTLTDDGASAPPPNSNTSAPRIFTITVNPINDPPVFTLTGNPPAVDEDAGPQTVAAFATGMSTGPANESAQALTVFTVTQTGSTGGLNLAAAIDVTTGNLTYQAPPNANGTATFSVTLSDNGSGILPNVNTSAPQSFTITINPINDAPSFTLPSTTTSSDEDAGLQTVANFATARSAGPPNENTQTLSFTVIQTASTGLTFATAPAISGATGALTYQAAPDANGTATFSVVLVDSGLGTPSPNVNTSAAQTFTITVNPINDGPTFTLAGNPPAVDEDTGAQTVAGFATALSTGPPDENGQTLTGFTATQTGATGGLTFTTAPAINLVTGDLTYQAAPNANGTATFSATLRDNGSGILPNVNTSAPRFFTIIVNPINDAPSFALPSTTTSSDEDAGVVTAANFATAISAGPANEGSQTLTFTFTQTGSTGGLTFTAGPAIDPVTGVLSYQAALDANGTATFSVVLVDSGPGTPSPNVNTSAAQTFTITVNPINDGPRFTLAADPIVDEDAGPQTIAGFTSNISVGPPDESGQTLLGLTLTLTGTTGGLTFTTAPALDPATGNLTYEVAPDSNGTATFNVTLTDDGPAGPPPNTNVTTKTFTINVNAIDDAPSFVLAGDPPSVDEDAGAQTVANFAAAISAGPSNESSQTLTFIVAQTGSTGGLTFTTAPAIDPATGALTYQTAPDANGTATFSVTLMDSGPGAPPPNVNTSADQTFTIIINPINDAPVFALAGNPPSLDEDAGAQTVAGFASGISAGPVNESLQTLSVAVTQTSSTGGLTFTTLPNIDLLTGELTYEVAPDANGSATFSVVLTDSGVGAPAPNANASVAHTFTITVDPVNDAPTFALAGNPPFVVVGSGLQTVANFASGISVGPANESAQALLGFTLIQTGSTSGLTFTTTPTINSATGALTYQATATGFGTATYSVTLADNGVGGPAPNANTSPPQTFTISVLRASSVTVPTPANSSYGQPMTLSVTVAGVGGLPTGTVTVTDTIGGSTTTLVNNLSLAGGIVSGNAIAIPVPLGILPAGNHNIQVAYNGDANFVPSSKVVNPIVNLATTQTVLSPTGASFFGQQVSFTATVNATSAGTPGAPTSGIVTFKDGAATLATVSLSGSNVAVFTTSASQLAAGAHSITAVFGGTTNFAASLASAAGTQNVSKATTQTVLSPLAAVNFGNAVTFTATVSVTSAGTPGNPVGTVTFKEGSSLLGTGTLDGSGHATFTTTATRLAVGNNHSITAAYNVGANFAASLPSTALTQVVNKVSTLTTLSPLTDSFFGNKVVFTATVTNTSGGSPGALTGIVTFKDGAVTLGTAALKPNGVATFTTTATQLAAGDHAITATYGGSTSNANFAASPPSATLTQTVNQAVTSTVLTAAPAMWASDKPTTFTATVSLASGAATLATGTTLTFMDGGAPLGLGRLISSTATHAIYVFTAKATALTIGTHTITAVYSGNANIAGASSAPQTQNVRKFAAITLASTSRPTDTAPVTFTATLTGVSGPIANGTLTFVINGVPFTATTNSKGVATVTITFATTGILKVVASFSGDADFSPASATLNSAVFKGRLV